ncbi:MAG: hypothetical protein FWC73_12680 [Defluviitaleaceae bacterium]|nr:hypothetical protein [Defluviitaleaceae bacterium]
MRKWLLFAAFALIMTSHLTAKAVDVNLHVDETMGVIQDFCGDFLFISGEALTLWGLDDLEIQVGDVPIYDLLTGLPVSVNSILPGIEARVAYTQPKDILPQALTIWLHPNHEDAAVFTVAVSDNIRYGPGYCVFLSTDGKYRVTLTEDTYILDTPYGPISPEDVVPGQAFFVWVDMITASSPALVYPDKVVSICKYQ